MARVSFSLLPAQAVLMLRYSRGIGIGEQVPRCGRTKQEPVYEVGGVFHTEGAEGGIGERERDVRAAKSRDIRHVKPRAVRPIVREHEVEIRLADDAVAVKIRQHGGKFGLADNAVAVEVARDWHAVGRSQDGVDRETLLRGKRRTGEGRIHSLHTPIIGLTKLD